MLWLRYFSRLIVLFPDVNESRTRILKIETDILLANFSHIELHFSRINCRGVAMYFREINVQDYDHDNLKDRSLAENVYFKKFAETF